MSLYRWFRTQVYWLIPDSFKSQNINEFNGDTDLVTVYKVTDENGVYENRNVTLNQLSGLVNPSRSTVTQSPNNDSPVTINSYAGVITMAAPTTATGYGFAVNNSFVKSDSVILITIEVQGAGTDSDIVLYTKTITDGQFKLYTSTVTGTSVLPIKIHFLVLS